MNGERLRQARELCGLTQQGLADLTEVTQPTIAQIEAGLFQPTDTVAELLSRHTGFDLKFLNDTESPQEFPVGSLLYRGKAKVSPKDRAKAHKLAQLVFEIVLSLKTRFRPIPVTLPRFAEESPTDAARLTRSHLGLSPDTPIKNITSVLERAGVLIIRVPLDIDGLDGFSAWVGRDKDVPVLCLVGPGVGYRDRYTASEEAGHLTMHAPLRITVAEAEEEVKDFVGEFVLPEEAMRREMAGPVTLASLASLRHRWGASIQFLAKRSHQLGITTDNQFKYLMQQISAKGWRTTKREPGDETIPQETPHLLHKLLESTYGNPIDLRKVRRDLGIPMWLVKSITEAHGISSIQSSSVVQMNAR